MQLGVNAVFFSGIVRGVDMEKHLYHILTPVPPENLRTVNCLLLGNIAIPNCIFVSQVGVAWEEGGKTVVGVNLAGRFLLSLGLTSVQSCLDVSRWLYPWDIALNAQKHPGEH